MSEHLGGLFSDSIGSACLSSVPFGSYTISQRTPSASILQDGSIFSLAMTRLPGDHSAGIRLSICSICQAQLVERGSRIGSDRDTLLRSASSCKALSALSWLVPMLSWPHRLT